MKAPVRALPRIPALTELLLWGDADLHLFSGIHFHFGIHVCIDNNARANFQISFFGGFFIDQKFGSFFQHDHDRFVVRPFDCEGVVGDGCYRPHDGIAVSEQQSGEQ